MGVSAPLRLVIFDVDGTLVDSQNDIVDALSHAFVLVGRAIPDRAALLSGVGLSLEVLMPRLVPDADSATHATMITAYKEAYMSLRAQAGVALSSPLYPGALDVLHRLDALPDVVLGIATGKSKRGLDKLIEGHGLEGLFVTQQVADFHPSKPHPSMIETAMAEAGADAAQTIMIGDTSFDMEMAQAAGVSGIGVTWGYHPRASLVAAHVLVDDYAALEPALHGIWGASA